MFDIQSYQKAESVNDAIRLLGEDPEARLIAGGTDVLIKLREFKGFSRLVDLHGLPELKPIVREADGTVRVGSGASFTDIEESPVIRGCIPMLGDSAASVAGPQIRNMGTIGRLRGHLRRLPRPERLSQYQRPAGGTHHPRPRLPYRPRQGRPQAG